VQPLLEWKSSKYYIFWVYFCSLRYPVWNAHALCCHLCMRYVVICHLSGSKTYFNIMS